MNEKQGEIIIVIYITYIHDEVHTFLYLSITGKAEREKYGEKKEGKIK